MPLDNASRNALIAALAEQLAYGADEAIAEQGTNKCAWPKAAPPAIAPQRGAASARSSRPTDRDAGGPKTGGPKTGGPKTGGPETDGPETGAPETGAPRRPPAAPARGAPVPPAPEVIAFESARAAAAAAGSIAELKAALESFEGSPLRQLARGAVFADGDPAADLMVIGEAPGREEDRKGLPFVGISGQLLDRMLAAIGRDRRSADPAKGAYITNVIPYRPLENRTPGDAEVAALLPFMARHIELARPKLALCLGNVPAKHLMGADRGITRYRGTWATVRGDAVSVPALATFHPAYLLRSPDMKKLAWRDLIALEARLAAPE